MNDLISRQDAIDAMATWDWQEMYLPIHFKQLLDSLPSAQQWIPCSERLPENDDDVLVTTSMGYVTDGKYWHEEKLWIKNLTVMSVTAWMPLPQPWGEEKVEGEPIPQWRGCMDGCLPYYDGKEVKE